jgi:uncharacterized membrane protein
MGYAYMLVTVLMTTYGNLVFKWRVDEAGAMPAGTSERISWFAKLLSSPWILTSFAAGGLAALAYLLALQRLELSRAYPVMSLSFVLVLAFSAWLFGESVTLPKVLGILLILTGLFLGSRTWG